MEERFLMVLPILNIGVHDWNDRKSSWPIYKGVVIAAPNIHQSSFAKSDKNGQ